MLHWNYFRQIMRHKWHVFRYCVALGVIWRGIIHDWTKFLPSEWGPHARWFGVAGTREQGAFSLWELDRAWCHHQHRNKHHWQRWVAWSDLGDPVPIEIPSPYREEMLADWLAINLHREGSNPWHFDRSDNVLHPETRNWLRGQLKKWPEANIKL